MYLMLPIDPTIRTNKKKILPFNPEIVEIGICYNKVCDRFFLNACFSSYLANQLSSPVHADVESCLSSFNSNSTAECVCLHNKFCCETKNSFQIRNNVRDSVGNTRNYIFFFFVKARSISTHTQTLIEANTKPIGGHCLGFMPVQILSK